jgi:glycosyltransferase involved in cell wall biosynthesis
VGRNESKTLPRLLGSLKEFFERGGDMVFVDTGSKDNTAQIARDAGCRVYEEGDRFRYVVDEEKAKAINEKFVVDGEPDIIKAGDSFFAFDQARNYAMGLSSNDFICTPDCDEAWTVLNIDRINELITEGYEKFLVDFVFAHNHDGTPSVAFSADTRFYDRRKISWKGIIHETMQGEARMTRITKDVAYLEHYQNQETDRTRYLAGLAWACYEEPDNDRNCHYFARELMYRGYYKSAIKEFERHIAMDRWADERGQSMVYLGVCYDAAGDAAQALAWWHKAFDLTGTRREPLINLAYYWRRQNKPVMVAAYAAAALQIPNNGFYGNRVANYTFEPHALLYWAKGWTGDIPAARQHWLKCYEFHPSDPTFKRDLDYYFAKPKVSIVIPSIRPDKLERCVAAIKENAGYENYEIIAEPDDPENPQGAPKVLARGVARSTGELVMFLGDDTIPQKDFLYHAMVAMHKNFPELDGLVGLNDTLWPDGMLATHWLASKKLLPYLGGEFFHTGYNHLSCDNELTEMCRKAGKYVWCKESVVVHDHPSSHGWSDETYDKHYRRVYQYDTMRKDRELLEKRSRMLGFPINNGTGCSGKYPAVPECIDLRKRITPNGGKVLNVGVGPGSSWLAQQLPFIQFKELDNLDIHKPYLDKAAEIPWAAGKVGFIHGDIVDYDVSKYDLMLMFDVIEHLPKDRALELLKSRPQKMVFVPLEDEFRENTDGVESQDHKSKWTAQEFIDLGYEVEVIKGFHGGTMDAAWVTS